MSKVRRTDKDRAAVLMRRVSREFGRRGSGYFAPSEAALLHQQGLIRLDPDDVDRVAIQVSEGIGIGRWMYFNIVDRQMVS